jgi:hypothetical protein
MLSYITLEPGKEKYAKNENKPRCCQTVQAVQVGKNKKKPRF